MTGPGHPELLVVAVGWDHDPWSGGFYPDDLPRDWRLTYYANVFRGVLVPAPATAAADTGTAEAWLEDTPEGFRFVLEVDPALAPRLPPTALAGVLGGRLAGVVVRGGAGDGAPLPPGAPAAYPDADPATVWRDTAPASGAWLGLLARVPESGRPCRALIQRFLANAAGRDLAVLAFPGGDVESPERMAEARVIGELLGA